MHNSIVVAFLVSAVAAAPLVGMWKAHGYARSQGLRLRGSTAARVLQFKASEAV